MPSPFPGMDPFIEAQKWSGFHHMLIAELAQRLVTALRPRYEVDPEERIYVETLTDETLRYRADVAIRSGRPESVPAGSAATATIDIEPTTYTLPMPQQEREPFLVIRQTRGHEVVTVIEILSPTNKRRGSDGRREYLAKRTEMLRSSSHLVEIDLLLGGERLPTLRPLKPTTDYCAFICRADQRPRADVFEWSLKHPLPRIPIPLAQGDADVLLDLQAALAAVFDRAGYDYSLRYAEDPRPVLRAEDAAWVKELTAKR